MIALESLASDCYDPPIGFMYEKAGERGMLKPKDIIDQLGVSAPTLRVWSNTFAPILSPSAQPAKTETGGSAQRRYAEQDLAIFHRAKALLDSGKTLEDTLAVLQSEPLPSLRGPLPEAPGSSQTQKNPPTDITVIDQMHPIIRAFEEALAAKDDAILAKDQTIASKDETIASLNARVKDLSQSLLMAKNVTPASVPSQPRFRWEFLNRLLTE